MFFDNSIDSKPIVTDPNGNEIVNLALLSFDKTKEIESYRVKKVPECYKMRPDLVARVEFGDANKMEYLMMFNPFGNPFSIDEDDVMLIPDGPTVDAIMIKDMNTYASTIPTDASIQDILVKNYYKFAGRDYTDLSSYDEFLNTPIPSGNTDTTSSSNSNIQIPYMLKDNEESLVYKNGRIYFNNSNDSGLNNGTKEGDIDRQIADILDSVATDLSAENCSYNGTSLSDFIKALNNSQV